MDRLPPHNAEAEQGLLGCAMLDSRYSMPEILSKLPHDGSGFYDNRHQEIFGVMVRMHDDQEAIDIITLQKRLKDKGTFGKSGGVEYLSAIQDSTPSVLNVAYYLDIVYEKWIARQLLQVCGHCSELVYNNHSASELMDKAEKSVMDINRQMHAAKQKGIMELVGYAIDYFEECHNRQGGLIGIPSGYPDLDKITGGLRNSDMIVIAARPSVGKTSLAMNIAEHVAVDQGIGVGIFSLEMSSEALVRRMICSRSRISETQASSGIMAAYDFTKMTEASKAISRSPIFIDDTPGLLILQLRSRARRMKQKHDIKLLLVDYLQLMHSVTGKNENRQREIADISNGLKQIAKELEIPVVVLSQLNRDIEREKNRKPRLSDLRESGAIEQDSDIVAFLYTNLTGEEEEVPEPLPVNLQIAKHRNGPTGKVNLMFLKNITRFESASKQRTPTL